MKELIAGLAIPSLLLLLAGCARHQPHAAAHNHLHGPGCGHVAIMHDGHTDYLDQGHLHHQHGTHADEHKLAINATNPEQCTPNHVCAAHPKNHTHGPSCGHAAVPHGSHTDYLVDNHLHHSHGSHCDDHGKVTVVQR